MDCCVPAELQTIQRLAILGSLTPPSLPSVLESCQGTPPLDLPSDLPPDLASIPDARYTPSGVDFRKPMRARTPQKELTAEMLEAPGSASFERAELANSQGDSKTIKEKTVQRSRFLELGFVEATFEDCVFNHSYFERCHFRKAQFINVSFINCFFRDCRFDEAGFIDCHFDYAEFDNCAVTYEQLASCLPAQENVLWRLARNLRVNASRRGQTEDYRRFLLAEIGASEKYFYKRAFAWTDPYYSKKYPRWEDRVTAALSWAGLRLEGFFWGHGEVPLRVLRSAGVVILLFAIIFRWHHIDLRNLPHGSSFIAYVVFSTAMFVTITYGDVVPGNLLARFLVTLEGACGLIFFGFLVAALYRRVSKR